MLTFVNRDFKNVEYEKEQLFSVQPSVCASQPIELLRNSGPSSIVQQKLEMLPALYDGTSSVLKPNENVMYCENPVFLKELTVYKEQECNSIKIIVKPS